MKNPNSTQSSPPPPPPLKKDKPKSPLSSPMEFFNSAINDTWKLCTLGGFLGLFLLSLLLSNNPQTLPFSTSLLFSQPPPAPSPAPELSAASNTTPEVIFQYDNTPSNATSSAPSISPTTSPAPAPAFISAATTTPKVIVQYDNTPANETYSNSTGAGVETPAAGNETSSLNSTEIIDQFLNSTTATLEEKLFTSSPQDEGEEEVAVEGPTEAVEEGSGGDGNKVVKEGQKCKMYEGRWVYKPEENPRYRVQQCPFLEEKMSCQKNGRPDFEYEAWSWESDGCQIPLFDGKDMLERMRGKRMLIAGDSLNRNKWESLACLLYTSIPSKRAHVDAGGPAYKVLKALDYDFTLEFYWAPFLVDFNPNHPSGRRVLTLDRLVPASKQWRGADVMVFNSGHWWTHDRGRFKPYDVFEYGGEQIDKMQTELAYERALSTWQNWLAHNVDPTKTKVYFRSISPEHKNKDWCFNTSRPIQDESYEQLYPRSMINVIESKLREINGRDGVHVTYLNITKMSTYRKDAHPGIFRFRHWKIITQKYKRLLKDKSDCSHWCLPGLPDTWNRILYASLFFDDFTPGELSIS